MDRVFVMMMHKLFLERNFSKERKKERERERERERESKREREK